VLEAEEEEEDNRNGVFDAEGSSSAAHAANENGEKGPGRADERRSLLRGISAVGRWRD